MNHNLSVFGNVCEALITNIELDRISPIIESDTLGTIQDLVDLLNARGMRTKHGKSFNRHSLTMLFRRTLEKHDVEELKERVGWDRIDEPEAYEPG